MRKKVFAFLTALFCAFSVTALPASAISEYTFEVVDAGDGVLSVINERGRYDGILVETDGTELTEDMVNTLEGYTAVQTWEKYTNSMIYWSGWMKTETSVIPEGDCYMVSTEALDDETLLALGRQLMLEQDCVKDVYLVNYTVYADAILMNEFHVTPVSSDVVLDKTSLPELAEFSFSYGPEYCSYYLNDAVSSEFYEKRKQACTTYYEEYEYMLAFADELVKNHSDIIKEAEVLVISPSSENPDSSYATSVWTNAGDSNSDGTVDSTDAAEMLISAAQIGTGADVAVTSAADVNADGELNAEDAAAVLTYAAVKGTGAEPNWVDILRK